MTSPHVAVVIPCYRVHAKVLDVIRRIGPEVQTIICVDDACPEKSGDLIESKSKDSRVTVVRHSVNQGVGGAILTGYVEALKLGAEICVKVDGDGQMDPELIPLFIEPIKRGRADYTKGNRFFNLGSVRSMPRVRLVGNAALSFLTKLSSGYWEVFDPTNGYTAIHAKIIATLPLEKISKRYFFESDMLFRLNTLRAAVVDIPMVAKYADEKSSLQISKVTGEFFYMNFKNLIKRIFYNYFLRDFSIATLFLVFGSGLFAFGMTFGIVKWIHYVHKNLAAPTGTVMLAVLPTLIGIQFILGFLTYDMRPGSKESIYKNLL